MSEVSVRFPLELELQVFVNPGTGAEKQTPVLCKSSKYLNCRATSQSQHLIVHNRRLGVPGT